MPLVRIDLIKGKSKTLYKTIAERIHTSNRIGINDVFVNLVEVRRENWSFGNGVAQYAM